MIDQIADLRIAAINKDHLDHMNCELLPLHVIFALSSGNIMFAKTNGINRELLVILIEFPVLKSPGK